MESKELTLSLTQSSTLSPSAAMAKLVKQFLSVFRSDANKNKGKGDNTEVKDAVSTSKSNKNSRQLVLREESCFVNKYVCFSSPLVDDETAVKEFVINRKAYADVHLINRGEVIVMEQFIIVDPSTLPNLQYKKEERIAKQKTRTTDVNFVLENKGKLRIVSNTYLVFDDAESFIKSGLMSLLANGVTWESSVIIKENTGTIRKNVEIVAKLGEDDTTDLDYECFLQSPPFSDLEQRILRKHNLQPMDVACFKQALCSISP